jgi:hypothetical protein
MGTQQQYGMVAGTDQQQEYYQQMAAAQVQGAVYQPGLQNSAAQNAMAGADWSQQQQPQAVELNGWQTHYSEVGSG